MILQDLLALLDRAEDQETRSTNIIRESRRKQQYNDWAILDVEKEFSSYLFYLLSCVMLSMFGAATVRRLDDRLRTDYRIMRTIVFSEREIASELKNEKETARKTLEELKGAQYSVQAYHHDSIEMEEIAQNGLPGSVNSSTQTLVDLGESQQTVSDVLYMKQNHVGLDKMKEKVPKHRVCDQCAKLEQILENLVAECKRANNRIRLMEERLEEAEHLRRENARKTAWQQVQSWLDCGEED